jgi:hypothetical protein
MIDDRAEVGKVRLQTQGGGGALRETEPPHIESDDLAVPAQHLEPTTHLRDGPIELLVCIGLEIDERRSLAHPGIGDVDAVLGAGVLDGRCVHARKSRARVGAILRP